MGLLDVFRPRWKHSNPEIRLEAVKALDDDEALAQSASRDSDDRIRRLAIKQLIDPWRLQNVAGVQTDDKLRTMALGRARELFVEIALSSKESERSALAAVRDLDSQEHLADIAMKATRAAVRTQALDLVVSKGALTSIVRKSTNADVRRGALARIKDTDSLAQLACQERDLTFAALLLDKLGQSDLVLVAQKAKHKPVAKMARQRVQIDEVKTEATKAAATEKSVDIEALKRNARQFQLAREFESLAERAAKGSDDDGLRATSMQEEWAQIGADAEEAVRVRVERSVARWNRVFEDAADARRKLEQRQAASRASVKARELTERMSAPEQVAKPAATTEEGASSESAQKVTENGVPSAPEATKQERPGLTPEMVDAELGALQTLKTQLLVAAQSDRLRLLDAGLKELRNVERRMYRLPEDRREPLESEFIALKANLLKRIGEVKQGEEWKRWVNVQRLEKLCVQVEVLREVLPEFPDKEQAPAELASLRAAWRASVGPVHPAKRDELWNRFKTACDAVMTIVVKSRPQPEAAAIVEPTAEGQSTVAEPDSEKLEAGPAPVSSVDPAPQEPASEDATVVGPSPFSTETTN
jgi:DNA-directed RNA polymerase subunit L